MKKENKHCKNKTRNNCSNISKTWWKFGFLVSELVVRFGVQYVVSRHCAIWFSLFIKWSQFQADYWEILRKIDWRRECVETSQTWGARPAWRFWILVGKNILTKNYPPTSLADYWEILKQTMGLRPAWKFWILVGKVLKPK